MNFPTLDCARLVRDGGIDAMAALDSAVREAINDLSPQEKKSLNLLLVTRWAALFIVSLIQQYVPFPNCRSAKGNGPRLPSHVQQRVRIDLALQSSGRLRRPIHPS